MQRTLAIDVKISVAADVATLPLRTLSLEFSFLSFPLMPARRSLSLCLSLARILLSLLLPPLFPFPFGKPPSSTKNCVELDSLFHIVGVCSLNALRSLVFGLPSCRYCCLPHTHNLTQTLTLLPGCISYTPGASYAQQKTTTKKEKR